jgi:hypothetical protein
MNVSVRLDSECVFDIGARTPDRRLLVKEYVKAIARTLAAHAGRPPGSVPSPDDPTVYEWVDGDWRIGYAVTQSSDGIQVAIRRIELLSRRIGL